MQFAAALITIGAHPRVGGENPLTAAASAAADGSSPRGRGKHLVKRTPPYRQGLIPAWAGKTGPCSPPSGRREAHPRVGGENPIDNYVVERRVGSSPRGRGKRRPYRGRLGCSRLIPAWAGKTGTDQSRRVRRRAHPRVGGENRAYRGRPGGRRGSSPRGRGKPVWDGIKTGAELAHPRVGGENTF